MKQKQGERLTKMDKKIHSNVWKSTKIEMKRGQKYYMTFTNDYSR